jgi:hypothetical protein
MKNNRVRNYLPKKIPLSIMLLFFISVIILLFFIKNILVVIGLFLFCLIFMVKFGQFVVLDVDPVPFCALLILHLYDYVSALHFIILALPIIDLLSSRLNHFSLINFISITATILVFGLISPLYALAIYYGIFLFNLIRIAIALSLGLGPQTALFSIIHSLIYFMLGSLIGFFI